MYKFADLEPDTDEEVLTWIYDEFADQTLCNEKHVPLDLTGWTILIAVNEQEAYEGSAYILARDADGNLVEVEGSNGSCFGFEGQWGPEPVTEQYLASDKFNPGYFYDDNIKAQIRDAISELSEAGALA
jgi:hypothetical protein